jgi:hypothetical protein
MANHRPRENQNTHELVSPKHRVRGDSTYALPPQVVLLLTKPIRRLGVRKDNRDVLFGDAFVSVLWPQIIVLSKI